MTKPYVNFSGEYQLLLEKMCCDACGSKAELLAAFDQFSVAVDSNTPSEVKDLGIMLQSHTSPSSDVWEVMLSLYLSVSSSGYDFQELVTLEMNCSIDAGQTLPNETLEVWKDKGGEGPKPMSTLLANYRATETAACLMHVTNFECSIWGSEI